MIRNIEIKGQKYKSASSQVVELIKSQISNKKLRPGEKLPTIQEMGRIMGVGNYSVRQALAKLTEDGVLNTIRGSGTFVAENTQVAGNRNINTKKSTKTFCIINAYANLKGSLDICHKTTISAIFDECKKINIKGRLLSPNVNISCLDEVMEEFSDRCYDGIIWLFPALEHWSIIESLQAQNIPIATTTHSQYTTKVPCVQGNEAGIGLEIGRYLAEKNCDKVLIFWEPGYGFGDSNDIRSGSHIGLKIGIQNGFQRALNSNSVIITDIHLSHNSAEYTEAISQNLKTVDARTGVVLANTKFFRTYLENNWEQAISLLSRGELIINTAQAEYNMLKALSKKITFHVSIYPLNYIGYAVVHKLNNILDGKFENTATLVNGIFKVFKADE